MDNKVKSLLTNTGVLAIGTFASKLLVFLLMPLYTAYLSPEEYGIADLISQAANLLIPIACIGICDGLYRFAMSSHENAKDVFRTAITILICCSAVFLLISIPVIVTGIISEYVWLVLLYVLAANFHSACAQYIRATGRMALFAKQGVMNTAIVIVCNIFFLVKFGMGLVGYVLSVVIGDTLVSIFLVIYAKLYRDFYDGHYDKTTAKNIVKYSIPMIPTSIFWWLTNVSDRYILTIIRGVSENGLYSAAYKIPTLITLAFSVFYEAWQIAAVKDAEDEVKSEFYGKIFGYLQSFIFFVGTVIIIASRICTKILMADSFYESHIFIPYLTLAAVFSAMTTFMGSVYLVKKKSMMSFLTSMAGALLNIVLNIILIPGYGGQGAAFATVVSYAVAFVIRAVTAQKYIKFNVNYKLLIANILLICAACASMFTENAMSYLYGGIVLVIFLVVNGKSLYGMVNGMVGNILHKNKN